MSHPDPRPKFYLTTPIYYANARPHVGSAYTTLVADTVARFKRMQGYDVALITGTDEHGENIARAAEKLHITPRQLVDRNSTVFRALWNELGIGYTHFVRTTSLEHLRAVRRLLLRARDARLHLQKISTRADTASSTIFTLRTTLIRWIARRAAAPPRSSPRKTISSSCRHFRIDC